MRGLLISGLLACSSLCTAEEVVREVQWDRLGDGMELAQGVVIEPDAGTPFSRLLVAAPGRGPSTVEILTIGRPGITGAKYAITGQLRHENVEGRACLEAWAVLPDGETRVTRTDQSSGPARAFSGTGEWRSFALEFAADDPAKTPDRLVLSAVFPGGGTLVLGALSVVAYPAERPSLLESRSAVYVVWCLAVAAVAAHGLVFWQTTRGRARGFAAGLLALLLLAGLGGAGLGFAVGAGALRVSLWVLGAVLALPAAVGLWRLRRSLRDRELRRMKAMDAM